MKRMKIMMTAAALAALLCACSAPEGAGGGFSSVPPPAGESAAAPPSGQEEREGLPAPTPEQFGLTGAYAAVFEGVLDQTGGSWSLTIPSIAVRGVQTQPDGSTAYFCTVQTGDYDVQGEEIVDQGARSFRAAVTLEGSGADAVWTEVRIVEEWETASVLEKLGMDELARLAQAGEPLPVVWQMPQGEELLADYCQETGLTLAAESASPEFS